MNTIFKHRIISGVMLFAMLFASVSCQDEIGLNVTDEVPNIDKTMLEIISSDGELANFLEVVNECGEHCADSLFNTSRVYTVWAPVITDEEKQDLIAQINNGARESVFSKFVLAHICNYLQPANGELLETNRVRLLNNKAAVFAGNYTEGYSFAGKRVVVPNNRVKNGILHKIEKPADYSLNIWEYLKSEPRVSAVVEHLLSYDTLVFDRGQSQPGPIVNGKETFLDSAFVLQNDMLNPRGVGYLNEEDSMYTVYVPTNEVWEKLVAKCEQHHTYNLAKYSGPAELTDEERAEKRFETARLNAIKFMTYSEYEQRDLEHPEDSVWPAWRGGTRKLFPKTRFKVVEGSERVLSNGHFYIVDEAPFDQFDLWHDTIKMECENRSFSTISTSNQQRFYRKIAKNEINKDPAFAGVEISGGNYLEITPNTGASGTAEFKIPEVLSASYNVALIVVPTNIKEDKTGIKPNKFDIEIKQKNNTGGTASKYSVKDLESSNNMLDTLFLPDKKDASKRAVVKFDYAEVYNTNLPKDYSVTMSIKTTYSSKPSIKNNYDFSFRIDAILLIPVLDAEDASNE